MKYTRFTLPILLVFLCAPLIAQVKVGADLLFEKQFHLVQGKRVGLVTNHSALLSNGKHLADALFEDKRTTLVALFGPEHGIRGDAPDGKSIQHGVDAKTGVQVYSLYGGAYKPTPEMLKNVDVLIFDIQDVGARFYTYISTLSYAMEAAAELNIPYVVLDRPNPIRGTWIEGFVCEDSLRSFVGIHPIPVAHGMTVGELATLFNNEGWLKGGVKASLTVVKMEGWKRTMWYDETGLKWIKPSPSMVTMKTAALYTGTCFIEGTNFSEGRGTPRPFEYIGASFLDGKKWAEALNSYHLKGVTFEAIEFTPKSVQNVTIHPKYEDVPCQGIFVNVTDRATYEPVKAGVYVLTTAKKLFGDSLKWRENAIDRLAGTKRLRMMVDAGESPEKIVASWGDKLGRFGEIRKKHLLY